MRAKSVVNVSTKSEGIMNSFMSLCSSSVLLLPIILMVFRGSWRHCIRVLPILYGNKKRVESLTSCKMKGTSSILPIPGFLVQ
jgi:hypothetical protein